jgi:hypothetical protein
MKKIIVLTLMALSFGATELQAQTYVGGYTKSDGTYVAPHYRSTPNSTVLDNYSTKGNTNPYTGKKGTKSPYPTYNYRKSYDSTPSTRRFGSY